MVAKMDKSRFQAVNTTKGAWSLLDSLLMVPATVSVSTTAASPQPHPAQETRSLETIKKLVRDIGETLLGQELEGQSAIHTHHTPCYRAFPWQAQKKSVLRVQIAISDLKAGIIQSSEHFNGCIQICSTVWQCTGTVITSLMILDVHAEGRVPFLLWILLGPLLSKLPRWWQQSVFSPGYRAKQ